MNERAPLNRLKLLVTLTRERNPALTNEHALARLIGKQGWSDVPKVVGPQWPAERVSQLIGVARSGTLADTAAAVKATEPEVKRQLWRIGELVLGGRL